MFSDLRGFDSVAVQVLLRGSIPACLSSPQELMIQYMHVQQEEAQHVTYLEAKQKAIKNQHLEDSIESEPTREKLNAGSGAYDITFMFEESTSRRQ